MARESIGDRQNEREGGKRKLNKMYIRNTSNLITEYKTRNASYNELTWNKLNSEPARNINIEQGKQWINIEQRVTLNTEPGRNK